MHKCKHNPTFGLDRGFCTQSRLSSCLSSVYHFVTSPPLFPSPVSSRSSPCSSSLPCLLHFRVPLISSSPSPPLFLSVTLSGFVMAAVIQQDVMRRGEGRKGDVPRGTRSNGILLLSAPDRMSSCWTRWIFFFVFFLFTFGSRFWSLMAFSVIEYQQQLKAVDVLFSSLS